MGMPWFRARLAVAVSVGVTAVAAMPAAVAVGQLPAAALPAATAPPAAVTVALPAAAAPAAKSLRTERPGRWKTPVYPLAVLATFDPPAEDWLPGHRGVDLAAFPGSTVAAPALGTVTFAGLVGGRPVVTIDHGALRTTYEPVTATVPVGHTLVGGQEFGVVGNGGHCDGVCVHWGAIADEAYVDPLHLLRGYVPVLKTPW